MRTVTRRHLHARRDANVEARLIMHQNDVRQLSRRLTTVLLQRIEMAGNRGIRLHEAVHDHRSDGIDTGARESGDVIFAAEGFVLQQRNDE